MQVHVILGDTPSLQFLYLYELVGGAPLPQRQNTLIVPASGGPVAYRVDDVVHALHSSCVYLLVSKLPATATEFFVGELRSVTR